MDNHQERLDSYFKKLSMSRKTGGNPQSSKGPPAKAPERATIGTRSNRGRNCATTSSRNVKPMRRNVKPKVAKGMCNIAESLPEEILLGIFWLLSPRDLSTCACVCQRWLKLAGDNLLWQPLYEKYKLPQLGKPDAVYTTHAGIRWKSAFMERCMKRRNGRLKHLLKKKAPFTGLPANTDTVLEKLGVKWNLAFTDRDGNAHSLRHSDVCYFGTSVTVRWYSGEFIPVESIERLDLTTEAPILFEQRDGTPIEGSPQKSSLLLSIPWKAIRDRIPDSDDDTLNLRLINPGVVVATWKDGGGIAFVSISLHKWNLVERCLLGGPQRSYQPAIIKPKADDVDTQYGLHGFKCNVDLRQQRSLCWSERFLDLFCPLEHIENGLVTFTMIHVDEKREHSTLYKKLCLPWKTDLFKGIHQDLCILDVSLFDEFGQPFWCVSNPVHVKIAESSDLSLVYHGHQFLIHYSDEKGDIDVTVVWDEEEAKHLVTSLVLRIRLEAIDSWFSTNYGLRGGKPQRNVKH